MHSKSFNFGSNAINERVKLIIDDSFNKLGENNVSHLIASGHFDITKNST
jgi:hypothetical protein